MSFMYLRYLCLFVYSAVQYILCCVFGLFVFVLCLVYPMLPVSLDCPSLIAPSEFANVFFPKERGQKDKQLLTKHYIESKKVSNTTNPHYKLEGTHIFQKCKQVLFY